MVVVFLSMLCLLLAGVLLLIVIDIRRVTKELIYINEHTTNGFVTANTNFPLIRKLISASNLSLKVSRKLQQAQAHQENQIRKMLTNLTHDIKTPLTVSMGYVQLMVKSATQAQQPRLKRIERNLDSVNYYLRYLMDFNLMQEKSTTLKVKQVNVSHLLENELFNYYDEFTKQSLEMTPVIEPDVMLQTDATLLIRVCQNLIGNILKYGQKQAQVTLAPIDDTHIKIEFANRGNQLPKDPAQLLNRFYTADQSRSDQSVGLGFSIVQSLVTTLGGRLHLSTEDGWFRVAVILKPLKD
ncbi:sensor histidine kinase [Lentilactobacillus diolivorans]|nr:HAMP domain-containing sensor histidine kinase [Lentilactobacillus diolivorans]GEP23557.1 two-component sensor histidine kinase [Lentilactobacillus diolivorans]